VQQRAKRLLRFLENVLVFCELCLLKGLPKADSGVKVVSRFGAAAAEGPRKKYRIEIPQATMPGDIANYKMPNFAKQHFRQSTKSNIRKDQELSYSKKSISMSLLPMSDELSKKAVDIFGKILLYTSKKPPAKPEIIVEFILTEALVEEKLRDELYCQVISCSGSCWEKKGRKIG
jgi:hypothetical protein